MVEIPETERRKILAIAREVRKHVRKAAGVYCPPQGLCGEASLALSVRLTHAGIPHRVILGEWKGPVDLLLEEDELDEPESEQLRGARQHSWIEFPRYENAILDVTADQYSEHPDVRPVWFPASSRWYRPIEDLHPATLLKEIEAEKTRIDPKAKPLVPLTGPRFRRPVQQAKVRVRNHLRHPPRSCLCHYSKTMNRVRRKLVRRLK